MGNLAGTKHKGGPPLGNTNSTKSKLFYQMLQKLITDDEMNLLEKKRRLYLAAGQLLNQAASGEEWAIKELANRIDGKSKQQVEVSAGDGMNFFDPKALRNLSPKELSNLQQLLQKASAE